MPYSTHRIEATGVTSLNTQSPSERWDVDCALGHADLLLRDHYVAWRAIDPIGQSPLPRLCLLSYKPFLIDIMGLIRKMGGELSR